MIRRIRTLVAGAVAACVLATPTPALAAPPPASATVRVPGAPAAGATLAWSTSPERLVVPQGSNGPIYWKWCAWNAKPTQLVKIFSINRSRDAVFLCGSHAERYGYRHMVENRARWEGLTPGTYQTWKDIADLAMRKAAWDPLWVEPAAGGQQCRSATIHLINLRTGRRVRSVDLRMYIRASDGRINTVIPGGWC